MENGPFEDVFPFKNGDIPLLCYIVYQRVSLSIFLGGSMVSFLMFSGFCMMIMMFGLLHTLIFLNTVCIYIYCCPTPQLWFCCIYKGVHVETSSASKRSLFRAFRARWSWNEWKRATVPISLQIYSPQCGFIKAKFLIRSLLLGGTTRKSGRKSLDFQSRRSYVIKNSLFWDQLYIYIYFFWKPLAVGLFSEALRQFRSSPVAPHQDHPFAEMNLPQPLVSEWMTLQNETGTLPKTNSSPLKIGLPKRNVVFQPSFLRCYVSFRECTLPLSVTFDDPSFHGWSTSPLTYPPPQK